MTSAHRLIFTLYMQWWAYTFEHGGIVGRRAYMILEHSQTCALTFDK
jgi:hypothetical protein